MMRPVQKAILLLAATAGAASLHAREFSPAEIEFFEKDVRPLLANHCYECHSDKKKKGGLRLDSRAMILSGGESGPAAVAGKPAESLLIAAVHYNGDTQMPPKYKLKDAEIAALTQWINLEMPWPGAAQNVVAAKNEKGEYVITPEQRSFWSFQPLKIVAPPPVRETAWVKNEIDRYILAPIEAKGLKPAPAADRRMLIRRATFDLTGLPPKPKDVDAFLQDSSPDAFAKVVDRLLASPGYGERWGRHWLDVVRYADSRDSRGQGNDVDIADAWRYRDWVVNAFNQDMPYDQFIIHQIAGDLIPAKEPGQVNAEGLIATGMLTIGEWGTGDADKEKMMTDIVDDQIDVVSRGVMGLTIACARCHDHKFDPVSTADYYSLAGIFFSTHIIPSPGRKTDGSPMLRTPLVPAAEIERANRYKSDVANLEKQLASATDAEYAAFSASLIPQSGKYLLSAWRSVSQPEKQRQPLAAEAASAGLHEFALIEWAKMIEKKSTPLPPYPLMSKPIRDVAGNPGVYQWRGDANEPGLMINTNDNVVSITTLKLPPKSVSVHPGPKNGVAVGWKSPVSGNVRVTGRLSDGDGVCGDGVAWALDLRSTEGTKEIAAGEFGNGGAQLLADYKDAERLKSVRVQAGDMLYLLVLPNGNYFCDTTAIEFSVETEDRGNAWHLTHDLVTDPLQGNPHADSRGNPDVWHFCDMAAIARNALPAVQLSSAAQKIVTAADPDSAERIAKEFQESVNAEGTSGSLYKELAGPRSPFVVKKRDDAKYLSKESISRIGVLREQLDTLKKNPPPPVPTALAAQEGGVPQSAHAGIKDACIHIRGSYTRLGERVPRRFPQVLAGDKQAPITQGSGRMQLAQWLVSPQCPLTPRVMANRLWLYHFGEGIVRTPGNFGKLGEPPTHPALLDFLAARFVESGWSMKAMHRLIMLSSSYQQSSSTSKEIIQADPDNRLFCRMNRRRLEAEALRDSLLTASAKLNTQMGGPADKNPLTARRMIYLMSVRSDRASFGPLFDAADSAAQIPKRTVSTVAPQALYMLNNQFVREQTAALAKRVLALDKDQRVSGLYEMLYSRPATADEARLGEAFLRLMKEQGATDEQVWNEYCQVLLCANEFVFVD